MAHPFGLGIGGGLAFYGTGANISGAVSDAETLAGSETDALAIVYTDDHFKATTGFNGSVFCVDSGTPANDYDSSPTTEAASYFTYTSPSPKMILHDDGVLKYAAHNICVQSEDIGTTWVAAGASVTGTDTLVSAGSATPHFVSQSISPVAGASYRLAFEGKADTADYAFSTLYDGTGFFGAVFNLSTGAVTGTRTSSSGFISSSITDVGDGWYRCEIIGTLSNSGSPGDGIQIGLSVDGTLDCVDAGGAGQIQIRKAHVHRYPADTTYLRTTSASRYADPIEFNSSGTSLGLLVEPQRTNLAVQSNDLDTTWVPNNLSVSASGTGADGVTGWLLTENSSAGTHNIALAATSTTATHCLSAIVEPNGRDYFSLAAINYTANNFFAATFTLTGSGSVSKTGVGSSSGVVANSGITALPGGRYLCWVTGSTSAGINGIELSTATTGSPTYDGYGRESFTGSGSSAAYVGHVQLEIGSSVTSRIRTYGSTVTRAADNISKASSAFPTDTANMTIYAKVVLKDTTDCHVLNLNDGSSNDRTVIFSSGPGSFFGRVDSGGVAQASITLGSISAGSTQLVALAYAANSANGAVDGTAATEDTSVTIPTGSFSTLNIGSTGATAFLNGHIKEILILPRRVSDADMQTLTSTGALP